MSLSSNRREWAWVLVRRFIGTSSSDVSFARSNSLADGLASESIEAWSVSSGFGSNSNSSSLWSSFSSSSRSFSLAWF